jgi:hypothetical protein
VQPIGAIADKVAPAAGEPVIVKNYPTPSSAPTWKRS